MTSFAFPLSSLDAFRFAASADTAQACRDLDLLTREDISERLHVPLCDVPDMADMVGPLYIEITCAGQNDDKPDHPAWLQAGPCRQTAARVVVLGCVHEHIITAPLCGSCIQRALRQDSMWCGLCREAGSDSPLSEITLNRLEHVDRFLMGLLMHGVKDAGEEERARIEEFVADNLDQIIAPHLREPIGKERRDRH